MRTEKVRIKEAARKRGGEAFEEDEEDEEADEEADGEGDAGEDDEEDDEDQTPARKAKVADGGEGEWAVEKKDRVKGERTMPTTIMRIGPKSTTYMLS